MTPQIELVESMRSWRSGQVVPLEEGASASPLDVLSDRRCPQKLERPAARLAKRAFCASYSPRIYRSTARFYPRHLQMTKWYSAVADRVNRQRRFHPLLSAQAEGVLRNASKPPQALRNPSPARGNRRRV